jgi:hypothetical protein
MRCGGRHLYRPWASGQRRKQRHRWQYGHRNGRFDGYGNGRFDGYGNGRFDGYRYGRLDRYGNGRFNGYRWIRCVIGIGWRGHRRQRWWRCNGR